MPLASQCQMSTCAPCSGVQAPEAYAETASSSVSGSPGSGFGLAIPLVSERMSDRFSRSSTQYRPLVVVGSRRQSAVVPPSVTVVPPSEVPLLSVPVPPSLAPPETTSALPHRERITAPSPAPRPVLRKLLLVSMRFFIRRSLPGCGGARVGAVFRIVCADRRGLQCVPRERRDHRRRRRYRGDAPRLAPHPRTRRIRRHRGRLRRRRPADRARSAAFPDGPRRPHAGSDGARRG